MSRQRPRSPASIDSRIVLVDPRPERRAVLRTVIEHADVGATVVGEAENAADAKHELEQHAADLVIIDLHPPVDDCLTTIAALRAWFPAVVILVCSFDPAETMGKRALASGADAYLLKPVTAREVMAAMRDAFLHVREIEATATPR
jgi:DNA-binding NarL/FixJ family response regulator